MGLGTYPQISLARARELLAEYRTLVAQKIDPIKYRQKAALEEREFSCLLIVD